MARLVSATHAFLNAKYFAPRNALKNSKTWVARTSLDKRGHDRGGGAVAAIRPRLDVLPLYVGHAHEHDEGVAVAEGRGREPAACRLQAPLCRGRGAVEAAALAVSESA